MAIRIIRRCFVTGRFAPFMVATSFHILSVSIVPQIRAVGA
jgi:hypothetical protein